MKYSQLAIMTAAFSTGAAHADIFTDITEINGQKQGVYGEVSQSSSQITEGIVGYELNNGLFLGARTEYDWDTENKGISETELGAGFRINLQPNLWIMPQVTYTFDNTSDSASYVLPDDELKRYIKSKNDVGDSWKIGFQSGMHFDNGLFLGAGYHYHESDNNLNIQGWAPVLGEADKKLMEYGIDDKIKGHRAELVVGYQMPNAVVTASYIYNKSKDNLSSYSELVDPGFTNPGIDPEFGVMPPLDNVKSELNELELKAMYTGYGNVKPYIKYTYRDDVKVKGTNSITEPMFGDESENELAIGVAFRF